jgi:signal transduction histidine kinase/FixJ family two-component response regulator
MAGLGVCDYFSGNDISFSLFYIIPIAFVSWNAGRWGVLMAIFCFLILHTVEFLVAPDEYKGWNWVSGWNALIRAVAYVGTALILTKLKLSVRAEREARNAAQRASQAKSDFVANMSHEVRTPLNAILGFADVLDDTALNREQKEYLTLLKKAGEHLSSLINDILDVAKLESGEIHIEVTRFNVRKFMGDLVDVIGPSARDKALGFQLQIRENVPDEVLGDPRLVRQILMNLLSNAIKFTDEGKINIFVRPEDETDTSITLIFAITDEGIGIADNKKDQMFSRFWQGDATITRRYGGSGLGLSICKALTEKLDGRIWFESKELEGTIFSVALPFSKSESAVPIGVSNIHLTEVQARSASLRILLAEDDPANRILILQYLKGIALKVDTAENGKIAVDKFKTEAYDIILMDMQMPELDGFNATRLIRSLENKWKRNHIPILALTASALAQYREKCFAAGCSGFISKPVKKHDLTKKIFETLASNTAIPSPHLNTDGTKTVISIDSEIMHLIPAFMEELKRIESKISIALKDSDYSTIAFEAHKIAGSAGGYGFDEISSMAKAMEAFAEKKSSEDITLLLEDYSNYIANVEVVENPLSHKS